MLDRLRAWPAFSVLIGWTIFLLVWMLAGLPVGPGAGLYLPGHGS